VIREIPTSLSKIRRATWVALIVLLSGCAADYRGEATPDTAPTTSPLELERQIAASAVSAKVSFHFSDFYSLMAPNSDTGCAGDAKIYHQPLVFDEFTGTKPFPSSYFEPLATIKPDFIKNISVDLTDANSALPSNRAAGCSYGTGIGLPAPTSCATFDYGAAGGITSSMGGSLLLIGGNQGISYASAPYTSSHTASCGMMDLTGTKINSCASNAFALAIETLPASAATDPPSELAPGLTSAEGPISSWVNLAGAVDFAGPDGISGGGAAFDVTGRKLLLFGGSTPLSLSGGTTAGLTSSASWLMDLSDQKWTHIPAFGNSQVDTKILRLLDGASELSKASGARMLFGYVAAQGTALSKMTSTSTIDANNVDQTDRIVIVGGIGSSGVLNDVRRFNPTYGPDWVDTDDGATTGHRQWLDSYHTQLVSNSSKPASQFSPDFPPSTPASLNTALNFGTVALRNNLATSTSLNMGEILVVGGFDSSTNVNTPSGTDCTDLTMCGRFTLNRRSDPASLLSDVSKSGFVSIPNTLTGGAATPRQWNSIADTGAGTKSVPWYGGATLLPGFDLYQNDIVYFGGTSCKNYLTSTAGSCNFSNTGFYWNLEEDLNALVDTGDATDVTWVTNDQTNSPFPTSAGMAAARGLARDNNVIIVAWGGASAAKTPADPNIVWVLYDADPAATTDPTWLKLPVTGGPTGLINASMVFSHVTGNFYLFGGYNPTTDYLSADIWELAPTSASCTPASCTFTWSQLNTSTLFSCYPSCPAARHSHRMVEANYFNRNPGGGVASNGESACTATEPCSFGIFMEGGNLSKTGTEPAADRWMFDPTANGVGQWIRMGELPPRVLPAMAGFEYKLPDGNTVIRRALLFGGETSFQSPVNTVSGKYFVAPTLGDTLMFDFDDKSSGNPLQWNRVELLGKGYRDSFPTTPERDVREAYDSDDPTTGGTTNDLSVLSPPPLSGAMMVTRTHDSTSGSPTLLKLPEIYLFGGRQKDGSPLPLDHVYKFCPGTTGEDADAKCDYFNAATNPGLVVPTSKYEGRWLLKRPENSDGDMNSRQAYLGAGTYDSVRDRIILVGGINYAAEGGKRAITQDIDHKSGTIDVFEYTPSIKAASAPAAGAERNGSWEAIPACTGALIPDLPEARYGHTVSYDPMKRRLILVGGYRISSDPVTNGGPLQQEITDSNGTYNTPDVWVGTRIDVDVSENEIPGVPEITTAPCYYWSKISIFGNTRYGDPSQGPPTSGIAHAASLYLPSAGYSTGYYTMFDNACEYQGPIASTEPSINKLLAGGAYIDIDRSKLGPNENVVLNLTYIPFGTTNLRPDSVNFSEAESAIFKVHLVKTGQTAEGIMQMFQPRYFSYTESEQFPEIAHTISVLAPPTGQVRQDQLLIPLSIDPAIDRVRIERYSGSGILIDASLFRMGYR